MLLHFLDINEIYSRIFHHRQFLSGEINYFLKELEVCILCLKRGHVILKIPYVYLNQSKTGTIKK